MLRHLINLLLAPLPPSRLFGLRRWLWRLAGIDAGRNARICGGGWIYGPGIVRIGENTWLSPGAKLYSHPDAAISIGSNCDLGHEICMVPGTHEIGGADRRAGPGMAGPIAIGNGCWVGARVLILGGVTIGAGAVVAAGSVVVADVPPNALVAGVPARVRRILP